MATKFMRWATLVALAAAAALVGLTSAVGAQGGGADPVSEIPVDGWSTNGFVYAVAVVGDTVYVGGDFSTAVGPDGTSVSRANVAAFDLATNGLLPFVADTDADVLALEADATTVWIGGDFSTVNGTARARLAAVDGATGAVVAGYSADTNDSVHSLEVVGTSLYAGGEYTTIGGVARNRIAKVDGATGALDAAFTANASHIVRAIAADPTGNPVYLGGDFTQLNGVTDQYLAGV
ncbi:MAG: hypothetical protein AAGA90_18290, partial [Actinomycetota bacterium]